MSNERAALSAGDMECCGPNGWCSYSDSDKANPDECCGPDGRCVYDDAARD